MNRVLHPGRMGLHGNFSSARERMIWEHIRLYLVWELESWKVSERGRWVCELITSYCKFIS